jgi:amino acid transporter
MADAVVREEPGQAGEKAVLTWGCYVGIEASARTQYFLLGAEIITLVIFSVVALGRVWFGDVPGSITPSLSWLNPFAINDLSGLTAGILVAVFIYWGWDSTVTVNEETEDSSRTPGVAAIISTIILVGIYVVVSFAAQAFADPSSWSRTPTTCWPPSAPTCSGRRSTSCWSSPC